MTSRHVPRSRQPWTACHGDFRSDGTISTHALLYKLRCARKVAIVGLGFHDGGFPRAVLGPVPRPREYLSRSTPCSFILRPTQMISQLCLCGDPRCGSRSRRYGSGFDGDAGGGLVCAFSAATRGRGFPVRNAPSAARRRHDFATPEGRDRSVVPRRSRRRCGVILPLCRTPGTRRRRCR